MTARTLLARWNDELARTLERLAKAGAVVHGPGRAGPPPPEEAEEIERALPPYLLELFGDGGTLEGDWSLEGERVSLLPEVARAATWGGVSLGLAQIVAAEASRRDWVKECFPDPSDPYDAVWHGAFAFHQIVNGDVLAVRGGGGEGPVVYLSHDDGEGHGAVLAPSFVELVDRWSRLAFVGPEDWLLLPFVGGEGLEPEGPTAVAWRAALGI